MRLGFAVKPLARPELRSHDSRRWQNGPHLCVSLAYLRDVFAYLAEAGIAMYRMASDLAPYATHPDLPQFWGQLDECRAELEEVGRLGQRMALRLSFHPSPHVVLNSPEPGLATRSMADISFHSFLLDAMGMGADACVVTHLGGIHGDREGALDRFVEHVSDLRPSVRRRVVIENDDVRFGVADALWVHERTGLPVVFDNLHHRVHNPAGWPMREALEACLATWPAGVRPKVHYSSPRTDWLVAQARACDTPEVHRTRWGYHSDYINPFEFIDFLRAAEGLPEFDVMLEARAKDLALGQLRVDLHRFAPDLAQRLEPTQAGKYTVYDRGGS